ncbi:IS3 family transposase [Leptospira noguchii]|uniref:IS3 family transposase n=1 Tax=Leptospira noguchii TaxID=28182 RepID=UPI001E549217|nr:IS3 family transposase [Leptospira noguchii]
MKIKEVYRGKFNTIQETQYFLFDYIERYYNRKRRYSVLALSSSEKKNLHNNVCFFERTSLYVFSRSPDTNLMCFVK